MDLINRELKKILLTSIVLLCSTYTLSAQKVNIDSSYFLKIEKYRYTHTDSIFFYSKKLHQSSDPCLKHYGYQFEALAHYDIGNYDTSEKLCLNLLDLLETVTMDNECFNKVKYATLGRLFWICKNTGRLKEALQYLIEKQKIASRNKSSESYFRWVIADQYNLAFIKKDLGLNDEAISIIKKIHQDYYEMKNTSFSEKDRGMIHNFSSALNILGDIYLEKAEQNQQYLDSAKSAYRIAYDEALKFKPPHKNTETLYNLRLSRVLIQSKKFLEALDLVNKYSKNQAEYKTTQNINFLKSILFYNLKKTDSSIFYCNNFLSHEKQTPSTEKNRIAVLNILAESYKNSYKLDSAYKYSTLAMSKLNDLNKGQSEANNSYYIYDLDKVRTLSKTILSKEKREKNEIVLLLSVVIASFLIIVYKLYKKREKTVESFENFKQGLSTPKKEYSIDQSLEKEILIKLAKFENSNQFLDQNVSIQILAKSFNTNSSYLSSIVNEKKGKTFKQYIGELRINYLVENLKFNNKLRSYTVQALAEEIGYTNASSFTRAFKKQVGVTPSDFLKSLED